MRVYDSPRSRRERRENFLLAPLFMAEDKKAINPSRALALNDFVKCCNLMRLHNGDDMMQFGIELMQ